MKHKFLAVTMTFLTAMMLCTGCGSQAVSYTQDVYKRQSVDEWCQANNITKANYYYRFAQVRKACLDSIPSNAVKHAIIPVPTELMHTEPESTAVDSNSALIQDSFFYTNVWNKVSSYGQGMNLRCRQSPVSSFAGSWKD